MMLQQVCIPGLGLFLFLAILMICIEPTLQRKRSPTFSKPPPPQPHPHNGKIQPYQPGDPGIELNAEALKVLHSGEPYKMHHHTKAGFDGRNKMMTMVIVQDIKASPEVVWSKILNFNHYAEMMVPKHTVSSSSIYQRMPHHHHHYGHVHRETIHTQMQIRNLFNKKHNKKKLQLFLRYDYYPNLNSLTWTLDYSRKSSKPIDDFCGYWYVIPLKKNDENGQPQPQPQPQQQWSRVYYSVSILFDFDYWWWWWCPPFVINFILSKQVPLMEATAWVKKHSELDAAKRRLYQKMNRQRRKETSISTPPTINATTMTTTTTTVTRVTTEVPTTTTTTTTTTFSEWLGQQLRLSQLSKKQQQQQQKYIYTITGTDHRQKNISTTKEETEDSKTHDSLFIITDETNDDNIPPHEPTYKDMMTPAHVPTSNDDDDADDDDEIGLTRYFLLASIIGMVVFNLYLCCSQ